MLNSLTLVGGIVRKQICKLRYLNRAQVLFTRHDGLMTLEQSMQQIFCYSKTHNRKKFLIILPNKVGNKDEFLGQLNCKKEEMS